MVRVKVRKFGLGKSKGQVRELSSRWRAYTEADVENAASVKIQSRTGITK